MMGKYALATGILLWILLLIAILNTVIPMLVHQALEVLP